MSEKWKTIRISNARLGLERLSAETSDDQFLRELVMNSIQAIQRTGIGTEIVVREAPHLERKLMVADNGPGMSLEELDEKLNLFAAQSHQDRNHGVGAKITTLTRNPLGVIYLCRTVDGEASRAILKIDSKGMPVYQVARCGPQDLPADIRQHGAAAILLGATPKQNTMLPPAGTASHRKAAWILKYLGSKFYRLPEGILLRAPGPTNLTRVHPQKQTLEAYCRAFGVVELSEARVHWYILPPTQRNGRSTVEYITADNYGTVAAHTAVLFEDELYSVDKGPSALRKFGILTGLAVLYVEPLEPELYIPNTARSQLLRRKGKGSVPFTIDDVAAEFRENMPLPIEKWQTELIEKSVGMNPEQMLEKLFEVHGHHLIPRPKAPFQAQIFEMPGTMLPAREEQETEQTAAPAEQEPAPEREQAEKRKLADDEARGVAHRADPSQPEQPAQQRAGFPKIQYVWVDHEGLEPGMFASFENHGRYVLTMNRQWPGIKAVLRLLGSEASKHGEAIKKAAQSHLELKLADAIYSIYEQREKRLITEEQFEAMLKPEALTAVAGQRYHMHQVLSRELKNIAA